MALSDIPAATPASMAIAEALERLEPHRTTDPKAADLARRLEALAPNYTQEIGLDVLTDSLVKVGKAEIAAGPLPLPSRVREANATRSAQLAYLRKMSPAAADAAEAAHAA